ncbi:MAG TPA: hypothetical protein VEI97_18770, partial [bacterium]|nr:hypothetical protein [bacterium]
VTGFSFPDLSTLRVDFEWTHPLPNTATRKDLHVFDVRLHILSDAVAQTYGGANGVTAPTGAGGADEVVAQADVPMANADGWSSWADEVVEPVLGDSDPSIYPFKLVHMDSGRGTVTPDSPAGWNVAPMSTTPYSVGVNFNLADGSEVNLRAALDASYGASAMKSIANPGVGSRLNPRYLNPEFNLKEPYFVSVDIVGTPQLGNPTTAATLTLTALDHQGPLAASGAFDPLTAPPTSLRYASALKEAVIAHPGLGTAVTVGSASFTGDGTPADPYIATVDLAGDSFTTPGTAVGLIAFRDQMLDSAGTGSPLPTQGYGRDLAVAARNDFATYLPFTLT